MSYDCSMCEENFLLSCEISFISGFEFKEMGLKTSNELVNQILIKRIYYSNSKCKVAFYLFTLSQKKLKIQQNGNRVCAYDKVIETLKLIRVHNL